MNDTINLLLKINENNDNIYEDIYCTLDKYEASIFFVISDSTLIFQNYAI